MFYTRAYQVYQAIKAKEVSKAPQEVKETVGPTVLLGTTDLLDYQVFQEKWEHEAFLVLEVLLDFLGLLAFLALREAKEQKEMRDPLALLDLPDKRAVKGLLDPL